MRTVKCQLEKKNEKKESQKKNETRRPSKTIWAFGFTFFFLSIFSLGGGTALIKENYARLLKPTSQCDGWWLLRYRYCGRLLTYRYEVQVHAVRSVLSFASGGARHIRKTFIFYASMNSSRYAFVVCRFEKWEKIELLNICAL